MPSPFPGMDPYLESNELFASFHHVLAADLMTILNTTLSDRYFANVEVRSIVDDLSIETTADIYPDVSVFENEKQEQGGVATAVLAAPVQRMVPLFQAKLRTVEIRLVGSKKLVTAIEILSPVNKRGKGLERYQSKREGILLSNVHLIELDLLRGGQRPGDEIDFPPLDTDYVCLVNRAHIERVSHIWPVSLNESLPRIPIPLLAGDAELVIDLQVAFQQLYDRSRYRQQIDYAQPVPAPQLRPAIASWLAEQGSPN